MDEAPDTSKRSERIEGRRRRRRRRGQRLRLTAIVALLSFSLAAGMVWLKERFEWDVWSSSTDTQVVQSVELRQDVTLLRLGIQGIRMDETGSHIGSWKIPGTGRSIYLQYKYTAMLGLDGSQVTIEKIGDKHYRVNIPEFKFLGHSDASFETAVEDGGVISFVTPDIDTTETINEILNSDVKNEHLKDNRELLKLQTEDFYSGIIHGVDPDITLEFHYAGE